MALPGDKSDLEAIQSIIRVNHAGEVAAKRIYDGQLSFLKDQEAKGIIELMSLQEQKHLDFFANEIKKRKVRPSVLLPFWSLAGYSLGALSGFLGTKASMLTTRAVEEVIEEHYSEQIKNLNDIDLREKIEKFCEEEVEHKNTASNYSGVKLNFVEKIGFNFLKSGCKAAIFIAKKL